MVDTAGGDVMQWARSRLGTVIKSKYRLDEVIGAGGMAVVFRATHRNQAEFAVKMLLPELSFRKDLVTRFLREGYAANSVKHSGVVQVVDDDIADDGAAFLVMELLHGTGVESLWLNHERRLRVQTAAGIVDQLLDVLGAAHERGIIHRDIKPANLFLTGEGVVKVLDFGIARVRDAIASGGQGTNTGMLLGTPAFMAPEQAKAQSRAIDAQTDLWAAGATLFTLVTGRFVHEGENAPQLLINTATTAARPISSIAPNVPNAIAAVVDRALAFDKANRWPTAAAMRAALREAYQATYATQPTREMLAPSMLDADDEAPPLASGSIPLSAQQTVPLSPMLVSHPQQMVGATTAQPISRQPLSDALPVRSRAPLWIALVAGGVGAIALTTLVYVRHRSPTALPTENLNLANVVASATQLPTLSASTVTAASAPLIALPSATTPTTATPPHATSAAVTSHATSVPPAASSIASPSPTKPHASCNPPYYFDADNRKIFKKECL